MNTQSITAPGPMQTMYDSLLENLRVEGTPLESMYTALTDLVAFDLHSAWNGIEKSVRLEHIRAALTARKAEVVRMAEELTVLLGKSAGQLERLVLPLLSDRIDDQGELVKIPVVKRANRPPSVWSRHPH
jgi:hypothetical protein